ncbi:MAG TPA: HNH endonuclease signature motif containing protein [Acidimicrobiales bacterium]
MSVGEALTTDLPAAAQRAPGIVDVRTVAESLQALMGRFDPAVVTASDAMVLVAVFDEIERMGGAGKALSAKRVSEAPRLVKQKGFKDPAEFLASTTGTTTGDAMGMLAVADAIDGLDATTDAFKNGELSPRKTRAVAAAARANPDAEDEMLKLARTGSLKDVEARSRQVRKDAATETEEQRAAKARRRRTLREWIDPDTGDGCGQWRLPPAEHARVMAALKERGHVFFETARRAGRHEDQSAYLADALVDLTTNTSDTDASGGNAGVSRNHRNTKILIRVDSPALERGHTEAGERCEITGVGPVPVTEVQQLLLRDDTFTAVVATDASDHTRVGAVAHLGHRPLGPDELTASAFLAAVTACGVDVATLVHPHRQPLAAQHSALEWISGGRCQTRGCTSGTGRLEIDHEPPWEQTQHTVLDELSYACGHCHDLKTHRGFGFGPLGPDGKRDLIPPRPP